MHGIEVQAVGPRNIDSLNRLARGDVRSRLPKGGAVARVPRRNTVRSTRTVTDVAGKRQLTSSLARAVKRRIVSGVSRLYPVIAEAAANGGRIGFTVRALRSTFTHDSGRLADSPGCAAAWSSARTGPRSARTSAAPKASTAAAALRGE
ncbi:MULTISPECIES: hypothetical protein [unclassified Streptomyces]|uniref:hypothetical protein n=1 Tax=unclassified Streptomyces TaxID=2593676 RepID=UPI000FBEE7C5|nr:MULTISPECIES: hypothetical protein [unclassified Streptomyces]QUC56290.1 hypothetical protein IOD14_05510 [Streptomyces sp. A2-16]GLP67968.1 hypothetical protein TUSST3_45900 [Streptomyces sp. TUS-ST3]